MNGNVLPYQTWKQEYERELDPSMELMAVGVGGGYPPGIFSQMGKFFDENLIKEVCLLADDVWLKFIEKKKGVKVKWARNSLCHPYKIADKTLEFTGLVNENLQKNRNDTFISNCEKFFNIKL